MKEYRITFLPDNKSINILPGQNLLEAATKIGIDINSSCGGSGNCDKCLVIPSGSQAPVRACQYRPDRDMVVTVPDTSRRSRIMQVLNHGLNINTDINCEPELEIVKLRINPPDMTDLRSDGKRLINAVSDATGNLDNVFSVSFNLLRHLPIIARESIYQNNQNYNAYAVIDSKKTIIGLRPITESNKVQLYGVAIDLGTTTIAGALVDLVTCEVIGRASGSNPQSAHGDDVISRINFTSENKNGLKILQNMAIAAINNIISEMTDRANIDPLNIFEVVAVGNATMQHILAGVPVFQIGLAPYVSGFCQMQSIDAECCGLAINPCGQLTIAPGVAGHVGGDTVAVTLASEMEYNSGVSLAVDIGTNGEIVLAYDGLLSCCSTAAGPAFEGAKINHGMRAANGAIERFSYSPETGFDIATIGNIPATGICGSGLVDILACLLNNGVIDETGRMLTREEIAEHSDEFLANRMTEHNGQPAFIVVPVEDSGRNEPIILTQRDVRETQLGKAAIAAGIEILLEKTGLTIGDIDRVYMAGAFGNYLHPESARRVGLFPAIDPEKIISIGNAAGTGAIAMLMNKHQREHSKTLANIMEYIELAARNDFQMVFADKMMF